MNRIVKMFHTINEQGNKVTEYWVVGTNKVYPISGHDNPLSVAEEIDDYHHYSLYQSNIVTLPDTVTLVGEYHA